jgi:hypothetical protein
MGMLGGGQTGVPVGDLWRLPDGSFRPMSPGEIAMKDMFGGLFGGGKAGESGKVLEGQRTVLSEALRER